MCSLCIYQLLYHCNSCAAAIYEYHIVRIMPGTSSTAVALDRVSFCCIVRTRASMYRKMGVCQAHMRVQFFPKISTAFFWCSAACCSDWIQPDWKSCPAVYIQPFCLCSYVFGVLHVREFGTGHGPDTARSSIALFHHISYFQVHTITTHHRDSQVDLMSTHTHSHMTRLPPVYS